MSKRKRDGLYRRGNIFAFRYKDSAGNWREKQTGKHDRDGAKEFRENFLLDIKNGTMPTELADFSLEQACDWWLEFRKPRVAPGTLTAEGYRLKAVVRVLGNIRLKQITNIHLDTYVTKRLAEECSAWSINKEVLGLSLILKKARLWRRLADGYKPLKTQVSDIGRALTRIELRHLAETAAINVDWEACFFGSVLAANSGLRGGELKKLRIGELDLERRQLRILRKSTKTDAGARLVELNSDALQAASRLLLRASLLSPPATEPQHFLLPKNLSRITHGVLKGSRGYDPNQPQRYWDSAWHSLTEKAGFPGLRFHDLRHSFISHMVERGVPLGVIQSFVGHMSKRMVDHYTHIASGVARRAVELLDAEPILTIPSEEKVYRA